MKRTAFLLGPLLFLMFACADPYWVQERDKVKVGMTRDEAIGILNENSWSHQPCSFNEEITHDLFFFGDHHYDRAIAVDISSDNESGKVIRVETFREPNTWHATYSICIDRTQFQD